MRLDLRMILEKDSVSIYDQRFIINATECCDRVVNEALSTLVVKCREIINQQIPK